jgi:hypothetical protein
MAEGPIGVCEGIFTLNWEILRFMVSSQGIAMWLVTNGYAFDCDVITLRFFAWSRGRVTPKCGCMCGNVRLFYIVDDDLKSMNNYWCWYFRARQ